jgi:hypothetical protein
MRYDHKIITSIPASDEGLEAILDEYGRQGYRFQGVIYDKIIMVKELVKELSTETETLSTKKKKE